jgi:hypothetical protein
MEHNPSSVKPRDTISRYLARTALYYHGPFFHQPTMIPASWPPEDRSDFFAQWWADHAQRYRAAGKRAAARLCYENAAAALRVSSRGRCKGAKDERAFLDQVIHAVQAFRKKGLTPTQPRIARYLMGVLDDLEDMLGEQSGGKAKRQQRSVVRRIQRLCHDRDLPWEQFIEQYASRQ